MSKSIFADTASFLSSHSDIIEESQLSPRSHNNASNYSPGDGISCPPYPLYACGLATITASLHMYLLCAWNTVFLDVMDLWML